MLNLNFSILLSILDKLIHICSIIDFKMLVLVLLCSVLIASSINNIHLSGADRVNKIVGGIAQAVVLGGAAKAGADAYDTAKPHVKQKLDEFKKVVSSGESSKTKDTESKPNDSSSDKK